MKGNGLPQKRTAQLAGAVDDAGPAGRDQFSQPGSHARGQAFAALADRPLHAGQLPQRPGPLPQFTRKIAGLLVDVDADADQAERSCRRSRWSRRECRRFFSRPPGYRWAISRQNSSRSSLPACRRRRRRRQGKEATGTACPAAGTRKSHRCRDFPESSSRGLRGRVRRSGHGGADHDGEIGLEPDDVLLQIVVGRSAGGEMDMLEMIRIGRQWSC